MLYKLFKRIYRKRIEEELRSILGYYEFVGTENREGYGQIMSWETFMKGLFSNY